MNHGLQTRSALVRASERGLGIKHRPRNAQDIECAINPIPQPSNAYGEPFKRSDAEEDRRREQRRNDSGVIAAICAVVIGSYLLMAFIAQVLA